MASQPAGDHFVKGPHKRAELLDWPAFKRQFQRHFNQGDQVTILGGPDSGKTHLAVLIAEMRRFSIFVATKPRDPLIPKLHDRGWSIGSNLEPMTQYVEEEGPNYGTPLFPRYVYWPFPLPGERATLEEQADTKGVAIKAALIEIQRQGSWCALFDELNYLTSTLRLRRELEELYHTARSNKVTLVGAAQRPSWVPRAVVDNPGHLFIFQAGDREELKRLGEIAGGMDWRPLAEEVAMLRWKKHEFLYVRPHERYMVRSIAEAW